MTWQGRQLWRELLQHWQKQPKRQVLGIKGHDIVMLSYLQCVGQLQGVHCQSSAAVAPDFELEGAV